MHPSLPTPLSNGHDLQGAYSDGHPQLPGPWMPPAQLAGPGVAVTTTTTASSSQLRASTAEMQNGNGNVNGGGSDMGDDGGDDEMDATRYCICNGLSYGDMIACDDEACETEWVSIPVLPLGGVRMLMIWCSSIVCVWASLGTRRKASGIAMRALRRGRVSAGRGVGRGRAGRGRGRRGTIRSLLDLV